MSRLLPAVAGSLAAHVGLAALLLQLRPALTTAASEPFVEVSAIERQMAESQRERRAVAAAEPPPRPRRRPPRRLGERRVRQGPVPPAPEEVQEPPAEEALSVPPASPAASAPELVASGAEPEGLAESVAAATSDRGEGRPGGAEARGPAPRRRRGRSEETCSSAVSAVSGGLRSLAYPDWLRDLGFRGRMRVLLRVGRDGRPRGVRVERGSGHAALDREVVATVRRLHGLPRCPRPISVPIQFELPPRR